MQFAFKTPTLRSVALRPPYMHNGSSATLYELVKHYEKGGIDRPSRSPLMLPLELTEQERLDLVAFMESLTGAPRGAKRLVDPMPSAAEIIRLLGLAPHPEGGHFRQTFRDARELEGGRAASTAIYFLLARGERSHWHKVDAVEVWHYYAGAPLVLEIAATARGRSSA